MANPQVLGLTGPFGSGATTAAQYLRDERSCRVVGLSTALREKWSAEHPGQLPSRQDLQQLGDRLRQEGGSGILVDLSLPEEVLRPLLGIQDVADDSRVLVVDGIRNTGEIDRLRELFGFRFTLIALTASQEARWDRIGSSAYLGVGRTREDYVADDARDRNEETSWGQAVELCVDASDIILANSADVTLGSFKAKVFEYFDLITGKATRHARPDEIHMNLAYSSSHGSKCIKRQVGAVVVNPDGGVVGIGYNENPDTTFPCVEEPKYGFSCYRDIVRNDHFRQLDTKGTLCPTCGTAFGLIVGPPWVCPTCKASGMKTSLESIFFPDRAMTWCTAIHAEVRAILAAGEKAKGATLFSTTFPCTQCSEFIAQAGILRVVFTESYPDIRSADRLDLAGIAYAQFEGVRSASFERIFRSGRSR